MQLYPIGSGNYVYVERSNTLTLGYIPVVREAQSIEKLASGIANCSLGWINPDKYRVKSIIGFYQLKDAWINLSHTPVLKSDLVVIIINCFRELSSTAGYTLEFQYADSNQMLNRVDVLDIDG